MKVCGNTLCLFSIAVVVLGVIGLSFTSAQTPQADSGTIEGTILLGASSDPVADVDVTLGPPQGTRGQAARGATQPTTRTGRDGKFRFDNVPAGNYNIRVQKLGYFNTVTTATSYVINSPISLAAQQHISDVELRLIQGAVIKGRVIDENLRPLIGVPVSALQSTTTNGNPRFAVRNMQVLSTGGSPILSSGPPMTNDRGEYRLFWLPPGEYYVRADYDPNPQPPAGRGASSVVRQTITTYFPNTNDAAQAASLTLSPGAEVNADIMIRRTSTLTISGRIVETDPSAATTRTYTLHLVPRDASALTDRDPREVGTVRVGQLSSRSFTIPFVPPGDYFLIAKYLALTYIQVPLDVRRDNINDLELHVPPPVTVKVQATLQGDNASGFLLESINSVGLRPELFEVPWAPTRLASDGTGQLTIPQGRYSFGTGAMPGDSYISDVRYGPRSVLGEIFTIGAEPEPLQVFVNPAGGRIEGDVKDPTGKRLPALVVLVPRKPVGRYNYVDPAENGHFTLSNLPPGEYNIFAFEDSPSDPWMLTSIDALGTNVTITQGGRINMDLRRIPREAINP